MLVLLLLVFINTRLKSIKKERTESVKMFEILCKCITANTSAIWQHAAHTTDQLLLAAKQEPYKKAYLLTKNIEEFSGKKLRRMDQQAEKNNNIRQKE